MAKSGKRRPSKRTTRATAGTKSPRRAPSKARARAAAVPPGPVTLDEAKAMARVRRPTLAARAMRRGVAPAEAQPASPAAVGAQREKLEKERREEIARRIREYKETMAIMKARGARRPAGATARRRRTRVTALAADSFTPLQIFAEGDSWFDYPAHLFKRGLVPRLENRLGVPILNLATAGDEVRYMLGVRQRALITRHLKEGSPAGGPWDVMLFSGGGNDIVDNPMALWIKDFRAGVPPAQLINQPRFDTALALVRAGYEDLIDLRNRLSPGTHLVFHGYDFAIPDGRGICHLGPWLKPTFDLRKFPSIAAGQKVVKAMLEQFASMLTTLALLEKVTFINGQGTLKPQVASWHNELHPSSEGFDAFADLFREKLKELFPDRVA